MHSEGNGLAELHTQRMESWSIYTMVLWTSAWRLSRGTWTPLHFCGCNCTGLVGSSCAHRGLGKSRKKTNRMGGSPLPFLGVERAVMELCIAAAVEIRDVRCLKRWDVGHRNTYHTCHLPVPPNSSFSLGLLTCLLFQSFPDLYLLAHSSYLRFLSSPSLPSKMPLIFKT